MLPPQHINNLIAASRLTLVWSVVTMPQSHPLPLSSLLLTHWPATCSLFLLPITRSSVLCASCYMSVSLVIKNALWLSHVLVYWTKENPNIIVINTNSITIQWHPGLQLRLITKARGRWELGLPTLSAVVHPRKMMLCTMFWSMQTFCEWQIY